MCLKLNLGDIIVTFKVSGYHKNRTNDWDAEWCKIDLTLQAGDWLNYRIINDETLLCCEIDSIVSDLTALKWNAFEDIKIAHFIEPDFEFRYVPGKRKMAYTVSWIINFWDNKKALTSNFIHLELDAMDIANLLNYLRHIQSESKKEYVPITGDGLTEEQLAEELKKGEEDIKAGRFYTADEVFEQLRKEIEDGDS